MSTPGLLSRLGPERFANMLHLLVDSLIHQPFSGSNLCVCLLHVHVLRLYVLVFNGATRKVKERLRGDIGEILGIAI